MIQEDQEEAEEQRQQQQLPPRRQHRRRLSSLQSKYRWNPYYPRLPPPEKADIVDGIDIRYGMRLYSPQPDGFIDLTNSSLPQTLQFRLPPRGKVAHTLTRPAPDQGQVPQVGEKIEFMRLTDSRKCFAVVQRVEFVPSFSEIRGRVTLGQWQITDEAVQDPQRFIAKVKRRPSRISTLTM